MHRARHPSPRNSFLQAGTPVYSIAIGAKWDASLISFSSSELSKIIPYFIIKTFILIMFPDFLLTLAEV